MKVVTYNIRYGLGLDDRFDLERIVDAVEGADIIALQEVERFWRRSGMVDQAERIGELLPSYYWAYHPAFDVDASEIDDDKHVINRRRQFGTMILSKWPISSVRYLPLPQRRTTNLFNMSVGALETVIATPLGVLQAYSIHLSSVSCHERLLQIDYLLAACEEMRRVGGTATYPEAHTDPLEASNYIASDWQNGEQALPTPQYTMIMGDFNSQAESEEYVRFAGPIDPIYGRGMHQGDLVDSWAVAQNKIGDTLSWFPDPADRAPGYPLRLDYCFISTELSSKVLKTWVDTKAQGSDHRPYWIVFDT